LVKRETGAPRVAWVGHSMGGAVLYGHAELHGDQDLQAVAVIASPSGFAAKPLVTRLSPFARFHVLSTLPHELPSRAVSTFAPFLYGHLPFVSILINARNGQDRYVRIGLSYAMANLSTRLIRQFATWSLTGELESEDGKHTYFRALDKVRTPWLAIAGAGDQLVPAPNVRAGFEKLGSAEKKWLLLAKEHGHTADYGHCDLVLGPSCREEVYAPIADWLERFPLESGIPSGVAGVSPASAAS
jgi:pimeloyl-ACP methyl ester carboxylesterase